MEKNNRDLYVAIFFGVFSFICFTFSYILRSTRFEATAKAQHERDRLYIIERGAEDDAADLALSEHQEVNYVRCYLRHSGFVTCQVHTPPADVEATCRARRENELLVDKTRCRWTNPETMAH